MNTQYLGWALRNREALLPIREQLRRARKIAADARQRLRRRMEMLFVTPDYYAQYPKACMDGWGRRFVLVSPGPGAPVPRRPYPPGADVREREKRDPLRRRA